MIDSMEEYTDTQIDHTIMLGYTAMTYAFTDIRVGVFKVGTTLLLPEGGVINLSCSATESYLTDAKRVYEEMLTSLCIPEAISIENAFYEEANNPDRITPSLWFDDSQHNYYKGISYTTALASDVIAKQIAEDIMNDASYTSDIDRVQAAATIISDMAEKEQYGMDEKGYYCSPSGVFMAGVYTCAGTTRALGRVLDYMGYEWEHMRENENRHQWCVLTMDGIKGFADGMSGYAGYGEYYSGITMPNGKTLYFAE